MLQAFLQALSRCHARTWCKVLLTVVDRLRSKMVNIALLMYSKSFDDTQKSWVILHHFDKPKMIMYQQPIFSFVYSCTTVAIIAV